MMQRELFAADECRRLAALPLDQREWTREPVDTSGPAFYVVMMAAAVAARGRELVRATTFARAVG